MAQTIEATNTPDQVTADGVVIKPAGWSKFGNAYEKGTPEAKLWAAANLDIPTEIIVGKLKNPAHKWRMEDRPETWHSWGHISVVPGRSFRIHLREGANEADLAWAEAQIAHVKKEGLTALWKKREPADLDVFWLFSCSREWEDEHDDDSDLIEQCTDSACIKPWHKVPSWDPSGLIHIRDEWVTDQYELRIWRARAGDWTLEIDVDTYSPGWTPSQVASLVSDLQYANAELKKATS